MSKLTKPNQRHISISGALYDKLRDYCERNDRTLESVVRACVADVIGFAESDRMGRPAQVARTCTSRRRPPR